VKTIKDEICELFLLRAASRQFVLCALVSSAVVLHPVLNVHGMLNLVISSILSLVLIVFISKILKSPTSV